MDARLHAALKRHFNSMQTRRLTLGGGLAVLLGLSLGTVSNVADAKRKRKRKRKNKKKRRKETTTADAQCQAENSNGFTGADRVAQSFIALRSGKLTRAEVQMLENAQGVSFEIQIRAVDETDAPGDELASQTIEDVPATASTDPPRRIIANFAEPATVVEGQRFAIVVIGPADPTFKIDHDAGNPCPGQQFFVDFGLGFVGSSGALVFETFVTA